MIKKLSLIIVLSLVFICVVNVKANEVDQEEKIDKFSQVIISRLNTFIITEDNDLWGCGYNTDYYMSPSEEEKFIFPVEIANDVLMVSKGEQFFTLFVKTDHTLWGYGFNGFNGEAFFTEPNYNGYYREPVKIMDDVRHVSVGMGHVLVVKTDNSLWAWGDNTCRQLGYTSFMTTIREKEPRKVMDDVKYAVAGEQCSFVIKSDGTLWGFGLNAHGEMGMGNFDYVAAPVKILEHIEKVDISKSHVLAVDEDGNLYGWGLTYDSQVVDKRNDEVVEFNEKKLPCVTRPYKIMDNVREICAGYSHSMAIKNDDALWAWGCNAYGVFADSENIEYKFPEEIMDNVKHVSAYYGHAAVIKNDGTLWAWGDNQHGQLGTGVTDGSYVPEQVIITVTASPTPTETSSPPTDAPSPLRLKCDVDGSGSVTLKDAQLTLRVALGIVHLTEEDFRAADADNNGWIALSDARIVLRVALSIERIPTT